jgi:proline iminopeptidase
MADQIAAEGFVPVTGGRVWYQIAGSGAGIPLLVLHGGPGVPHDYLEPLERLGDERPIVFYDQLGCGKSDRPNDTGLWRMERFVEEVGQVRTALQLDRVHLLGHSWGTMLAMDYALTRPPGLTSLVLASPILSNTRYLAELARLRRELPREVQDTLDRHEAAGTFADEAYQAALQVFYRRHLFRLDPPSPATERAFEGANGAVYETMWGPSEFIVTGNLSGYERTNRLHEVSVPTLFTCGRHDLTTPEAASWYHSLVPEAEIAIFEESAHGPHDDEPERYLETLRDFLRRVEARGIGPRQP